MAGKRARRRKNGRFVKSGASSNPHKKRRRRRHAVARRASSNPPRAAKRRRTRRRAYRNPPMLKSAKGAIGGTISDVGHGFSVVGGQVAVRKVKGAAQGVLPATVNVSKGLPGVAVTSGAALAVSVLSAMFTPAKYRRAAEFFVAGAWSEAINCAIALTPIAPFMSAFPRPGLNAWPMGGGRRVGVAAWPAALPRSSGRVNMGAWPMRSVGMAPATNGVN
jgi:hypothetical protein